MSTARTRVMALMAALGMGAAMFAVGPAAPARAASHVHATSAAPTAAAHTVILHARATRGATGGRIGPDDDTSDITCTLAAPSESISGAFGTAGTITVSDSTKCTNDDDGSLADVPLIDMDIQLFSAGGTLLTSHEAQAIDEYSDLAFTQLSPCTDSVYDIHVGLAVDFPPGFTPATQGAFTNTPYQVSSGDCPGDYVQTPDVIDDLISTANNAMQLHGLNPVSDGTVTSCSVGLGRIAVQDPGANQWTVKGSTVFLTSVSGRPKSPCP